MGCKRKKTRAAFAWVILSVSVSLQAWACETLPIPISPDFARIFVEDKEIHFLNDTPSEALTTRPFPHNRHACATASPNYVFDSPIPSCNLNNQDSMRACRYPNYTTSDTQAPLEVNTTTGPEMLFIESDRQRMIQIAEVLPVPPAGQRESAASYFTNSVWYRVSYDGGQTFSLFKPMIQPGYNLTRRFPGVFPGTNGMWTGASHLIRMSNGEIVIPVSYWPLDSRGLPTYTRYTYLNGQQYAGASFSVGAVLIGKWNASNTDLDWTLSQSVFLPETLSSRGIVESTVAELVSQPGALVMISRGSNELDTNMEGRRWVSKSLDFGRTWSNPIPLCYGDGTCFYSPSSASNLIRAQNARLYWIGNISDSNPEGNSPRYPLYMAELDEESLVLIRGSLILIDEKTERDSSGVQLAGFTTHLDATGVLIGVNRSDYDSTGEFKNAPNHSWYRIGFAYGH
jgi:hypothetical protein